MKIKIITFFMLTFLIMNYSSALSKEGEKGETLCVSIMNLIATPEKYYGRTVTISGFALLTDDDTRGVYLSKEDAKHLIFNNAVYLNDLKGKNPIKKPKKGQRYILVSGTFEKYDMQNNRSFAGKLTNIRYFRFLTDYSLTKDFGEYFK